MTLLLETLIALAQEGINRALSYDPYVQKMLKVLDNRTISIEIKNISKPIYLSVAKEQLYLSLYPSETIDLKIRSNIQNLWHMAQNNQTPSQQIDMQGNMHVAQQLSQVIQQFDPDWEEALSTHVGDVAGVLLANSLRKAHAYAKNLAQTIMQNTAEYVVDEQPLVAAKQAIDIFITDVEKLRGRADKLSVRVNVLKKRVSDAESI